MTIYEISLTRKEVDATEITGKAKMSAWIAYASLYYYGKEALKIIAIGACMLGISAVDSLCDNFF